MDDRLIETFYLSRKRKRPNAWIVNLRDLTLSQFDEATISRKNKGGDVAIPANSKKKKFYVKNFESVEVKRSRAPDIVIRFKPSKKRANEKLTLRASSKAEAEKFKDWIERAMKKAEEKQRAKEERDFRKAKKKEDVNTYFQSKPNKLATGKLNKILTGRKTAVFQNDIDEKDLPPPPATPYPEEPVETLPPKPTAVTAQNIKFRRTTIVFSPNRHTITVQGAAGMNQELSKKLFEKRFTQRGTNVQFSYMDTQRPLRDIVMPGHSREKAIKQERHYHKTKEEREFLLSVLRKTTLLRRLLEKHGEKVFHEVIEKIYSIKFGKDKTIAKQGDSQHKFFIIDIGTVNVFTARSNRDTDIMNNSFMTFDGSVGQSFTNNAGGSFRTRLSGASAGFRSTFGGGFNRDTNYSQQSDNTLGDMTAQHRRGEFFGEKWVIHNSESNATFKAANDVTLWALDRSEYKLIILEAVKRTKELKMNSLTKVPVLRFLSEDQLETVGDAAEYKSYEKGDMIVNCGSKIEKIYWLCSGKVQLYKVPFKLIKAKSKSTDMGVDDFIGDAAILNDYDSDYTLVARSKVEMLELEIEELAAVAGNLGAMVEQSMQSSYRVTGKLPKFFQTNGFEDSGFSIFNVMVETIKRDMKTRLEKKIGTNPQFSNHMKKLGENYRIESTRKGLANATAISIDNTSPTKAMAIQLESTNFQPLVKEVDPEDLLPITNLGSGQFGSVHLVKSLAIENYSVRTYNDETEREMAERYFALKVVRRTHKDAATYLNNEKLTWSEISFMTSSHFVVKLYYTFADMKCLYFLCEYCEGGTLANIVSKVLTRKRLDEVEFLQFYIANIILGLEAIHSRSIVYRDLKPENCLIGSNGYVKLGDFGLSKKALRTSTLCGTPDYTAPETIHYNGTTSSSDLWALGVLLFELVFGIPPFHGRDSQDTYEFIVAHKPPHFEKLDKFTVYNNPKLFRDAEERRAQAAQPRMEAVDLNDTTEIVEEKIIAFCTDDTMNLINGLLQPKITKRFGCLATRLQGLKEHPFFRGFDWLACFNQTMKAKLIPTGDQDFDELIKEEDFDYNPNIDFYPYDRSNFEPKVDCILDGQISFAENPFHAERRVLAPEI